MLRILIPTLFLLITQYSFACDCLMTPLKWHVYNSYDIIIGKVEMVKDTLSNEDKINNATSLKSYEDISEYIIFQIDTSLKDNFKETSIEFIQTHYCDFKFKQGQKYILFINESHRVISCSYSSKIQDSSKILYEINQYLSLNKNLLKKEVNQERKVFKKFLRKEKKKS